jgi:hypothetical protein
VEGVLLNLYDLSGKTEFADTRAAMAADTEAVMLVFDVGAPASFAALPTFVRELETGGALGPATVRVLCAHKSDGPARAVAAEAVGAWARANGGWRVFDTSAQSGDGIAPAIQYIVEQLARPPAAA